MNITWTRDLSDMEPGDTGLLNGKVYLLRWAPVWPVAYCGSRPVPPNELYLQYVCDEDQLSQEEADQMVRIYIDPKTERHYP